jgi:hypothetical protein
MQNKQLKRPYFPPEITTVEFRVERGLQTSEVQVSGYDNQTINQLISLGIISQQDADAGFYGNGMPSGNVGYFSGTGNGQDRGGYFGAYF